MGGMTAEERNLLSVGYKNVLGAKRASWRILSVIKSKEEVNGEMQHVALAKESLKRVEDELTSKCNEILLTIDDYLLPSSKTGEAAVFYHKMKGDYYRYLAEFKSDAEREEAIYHISAATAIAETDLPPTNPIKLGLALNFSVFYYEIIANTERYVCPPGEQNKAVDGVSGENLKDMENMAVEEVSGENLKDVENKAGDEE
ncbi:14-3-3 protein 7 [Tanacetum coccineum]